jgi:hypothetical protein
LTTCSALWVSNVEEVQQNKSLVRALNGSKSRAWSNNLVSFPHSYEAAQDKKREQERNGILRSVIEAAFMNTRRSSILRAIHKSIVLQFSRRKFRLCHEDRRGIGRMIQDQSFMEKLPPGVASHRLVRC